MRSYSLDDVLATRKRRDSWWTVFVVDPVACRVALFVANRTEITPNALTRLSLILGMASAACFAANRLALGAALFYVSFMIDCVDGKIARLKGTGTPFGLWLDYVGDRIRVVCCAAGIAYGQYAATGRMAFVLLGAGIAILDLFRYVNAPQMKRVRQTVKARRRAARRDELTAVREAMAVDSLARDHGDAMGVVAYDDHAATAEEFHDYPLPPHGPLDYPSPADPCLDGEAPAQARGAAWDGPAIPRQASGSEDSLAATVPVPVPVPGPDPGRVPHLLPPPPRDQVYDQESDMAGDLPEYVRRYEAEGYDQAPPQPPGEGEAPVGLRRRVGHFLARHRVRTHLMSGIEFHAAVFVVAPVIGPAALLPVTTLAGGLLVANEIFLVYRMWLSTRALGKAAPDASGEDDQRHVRTDPFFTGV
ncbi:CDP-alcohol phosphatidyltransferase family protein [Sphaerisporangium krabiense]|uniref:Phosphatidylglycerophosphate synthase n=1 Tax=Sphaerisporangium krabiense TaxID=763782 RepID=A0A7W8Z006_9ACTN|nr:CDP-alcohol phosphatidyltransferase family protein [Sphaerisporangium krabiense]MBB5624860.1 phosphatidylglycerophosphate synthase [Sphaerisporangium krabiense]